MLLCAVGLFFVSMTYGAYLSERSGVPLIGGLLIAAGFLTTPVKWLALLGLIDPGYWEILYIIITYRIRKKRFCHLFAQQGYTEKAHDPAKQLRIFIPDRNEELICPYITNYIHELRKPRLLFSVCTDKNGDCFILTDKGSNGKSIEISDFNSGSITLTAPGPGGAYMAVEISMIPDLQ